MPLVGHMKRKTGPSVNEWLYSDGESAGRDRVIVGHFINAIDCSFDSIVIIIINSDLHCISY